MSWAQSLQRASFKGVYFDVLSIEDGIERAIVEHHYAYAEGSDIEDTGAISHEVTLTAVFFGETYEARLINLLNICYESGGGVLVHPILGRLPDMQLYSARFNHDADNVDYVAFTLSFKKATKGKPLFSLMSFLGIIDRIFNKIDDLLQFGEHLFNQFLGNIRQVNYYKARVRALGAIFKTFDYEIQKTLDKLGIEVISSGSNRDDFVKNSYQKISAIADARRVNNPISAMAEYENINRELDVINQLPLLIAKVGSDLDLGVSVKNDDVREITIIVELLTICIRTKIVIDILKTHELSPQNIETLVNDVRKKAQNCIDKIRENKENTEFNQYDEFYRLIDSIRDIQHELKEIAKSIISKKPPFIVRIAPFDGALHQIAYHFYNDMNRYEELVRLNPHLTHPSFIKKGDFINGYSE